MGRRTGVTLIELAVVLSILAVCASLALLAIQSARESARKVACQNNLHQIGIAISNFSHSNHAFPSLLANRGSKGDSAFEHSAFLAILPELEIMIQKKGLDDEKTDEDKKCPRVFRCPSSNEYLGYRYCYGSGVRTLNHLDGITRVYRGLRIGEVTDGLSNTALMSERMSGKQTSRPYGMAALPAYITDSGFAVDCENVRAPSAFVPDVGLDWQGVQPRDLVYSHFSPPNNDHWDCQAGFVHQLVSARSFHIDGVFVLFADAHIAWSSSSVDLVTWRALGTVAGHESLNAE
jgi:prepilin-type N-terminal cleavage/methylation domain-containing protein